MRVYVRVWKSLLPGAPREPIRVDLAEGATVDDLLAQVRAHDPTLGGMLNLAVATTSGRAMPRTEPLADGQEIMFIPMNAGG
jgi:molybdopterin converting factor small subunit